MNLIKPRPLAALFAPGLVLATAPCQEPADPQQQALIEKRDEKLDAGFLTMAKWFTSFARAKAAAKEANKKIFAYFTRSYAP